MSSSVDPEGYGIRTKTGVVAWLSRSRANENPARQEKANRKKTVCVALAIICIIAILLAVCVLAYIYLSKSPANDDVLYNNSTAVPVLDPAPGNGTNSTSEPSLAEQIMKLMNLSVSPCDDFFSYACGGWLAEDGVQNNSYKVSLLSLMKEATEEYIAKLLKAPQKGDDPHYKLQPKKYFSACTDTDRLEKRGLQPFLDFLKTVAVFPLLGEHYVNDTYNRTKAAAALVPLGLFPYFKVYRSNYYNLYRMFFISPPDFPELSEEEKEIKKMWLAYNLKQLGVTNLIKLEEAITNTFILESRLKKQLSSSSKRQFIEVQEMTEAYPNWIDWDVLLKKVSADFKLLREAIKKSTPTLVTDFQYFQNLKHVQIEIEKELNILLCNMLNLTLCLGSKFKSLEEFLEGDVTREQICVRMVRNVLPDQILKFFADEIYHNDTSIFVQELVSILKETIHNKTNENDKMHLVAKSAAIDKLTAVQLQAGYLENQQDLRILNNIYRMDVKSEFFESHIAYLQRRFNRSLVYGSAIESWLESHSSLDLDVKYLKDENYLVLPAAFLQPPVTGPSWPSSMKFGALGSHLSRCLVKILLDNYFTNPSNPSHNEDQIARKCFVEQYRPYMFDEYMIDSEKSANDNIYDYEGLAASYQAYQSYQARNDKKEELLAGLNLDHDQLFFLAFAQMHCQHINTEWSEKEINTGNIPYKLRVLGTLKNSKAFAEVYKCKAGSQMSPVSRCQFF